MILRIASSPDDRRLFQQCQSYTVHTQIKQCRGKGGKDAEELWCIEAVHLVASLGHWDTVSSSVTFSNPNHVLCMASVGA